MNNTRVPKRSQARKPAGRRKSALPWSRRKLLAYHDRNAPPNAPDLALTVEPGRGSIGRWERRVMDSRGILTPHEKQVAYRLAKLFNPGARGWAWPSRQYLADMAQVSLSVVSRCLAKLRRLGLLFIDSGARKFFCSRYFPSFGFRSCVSGDTHHRPNVRLGRGGKSVMDAPPSSRAGTEQDIHRNNPNKVQQLPRPRSARPQNSEMTDAERSRYERKLREEGDRQRQLAEEPAYYHSQPAAPAPEPAIATTIAPKPKPPSMTPQERLSLLRRLVAAAKAETPAGTESAR